MAEEYNQRIMTNRLRCGKIIASPGGPASISTEGGLSMWKTRCLLVLGLLSCLTLMLPSIGAAHPREVVNKAGPIWAYQVAFTHYAGGESHYGAWFRGKEGYGQHYRYGDWQTRPFSGGIASWGWWGTFYHVLSTPKTWLLFGVPHSWFGSNYKANFQVIW